MPSVEDHRCTVESEFLGGEKHAHCSCGWVGGWVGESVRTEREALADFAAHVHVAMGWAVVDE